MARIQRIFADYKTWWQQLAFVVGFFVFLVWVRWGGELVPGVFSAVFDPILATDLNQARTNTTLPVSHGLRIQQTFYPARNGLSEVDILLAKEGTENGRFYIQLLDSSGTAVFDQELDTQLLIHGQVYTLRFSPEPNSAGRLYTLQLSGDATNSVSVQGYTLDVYQRGQLTLLSGALESQTPETDAQELRFTTRYQLTWKDIFQTLRETLYYEGALLVLALLFIPLPGCLILLLGSKKWGEWDRLAWWGAAFALGTAVWPFIWYGVTWVNGRFSGWLLWVLFGVGWMAVIGLQVRKYASMQVGKYESGQAGKFVSSPFIIHHSLFIILLLLSFAVRLLAIRDISAPPWVDASRHALITAVMVANGQTPSDYAPYLPEVTRFPYHFGFHTLSASLQLMTNWPLYRLLLYLGQLINGLSPLMVYAAAWFVTRRRRVALLAAFLVALPFFFPGYYATWGRMTQLTAVFLMPLLLAFTWNLLHGGKPWRNTWPLIGLLAAGLFLIHFRVFLFYLPFAVVAWLAKRGRNGRYLMVAALFALLLTLPRMINLLNITNPAGALQNNIPGYNDFPINYVQVGWEKYYLWGSLAGFLVTLLAALWRQRWTAFPLVLWGWTAVMVLMLSGEKWGLPETGLVNLNSMYIILFLPLALFLSILADRLWRDRRMITVSNLIMGGVLTAVFLFGVRQQVTILNPQTILVQNSDLVALEWVAKNLPADARLAVSSWLWLGNTWAASDGGAWIVPLTGHASSTPPADYGYNRDLLLSVDAFNQAATAVTDWSSPAQANWLYQQGITHIFVGAKGGFFDPAQLATNPKMKMVYGRDGVFVFEIGD